MVPLPVGLYPVMFMEQAGQGAETYMTHHFPVRQTHVASIDGLGSLAGIFRNCEAEAAVG